VFLVDVFLFENQKLIPKITALFIINVRNRYEKAERFFTKSDENYLLD
jgi:hypothetical protein